MTNIAIKNVQVTGAESVGEWAVMAADRAGRQYYFEDVALSYGKAVKLAEKVKQRGDINPDLWFCHVPYGAAAWELDGQELRQLEDEFCAC